MASEQAANPLGSLKRLSASLYLQEPIAKVNSDLNERASGNGAVPPPPSTILLFTWMDAAPRHIAKYISGYARLYPSSRIVIGTCDMAEFFRFEATRRARLAPAIEVLRADTHGEVILHLFSNGGAWQACLLSSMFHDMFGTALPVRAMILDSSPGRSTYQRELRAFSYSLPRQAVLRFLGLVIIHLVLMTSSIYEVVFRGRSPIDLLNEGLNDPSQMDPHASRCYIYSETDELVWWKDVEEHSDEAERKGWNTRRVKIEGSAHVGHLRVDERKYWRVVEETWESARVDKQGTFDSN